MGAVNYSGLVTALIDALATALPDVWVTGDPDPPTEHQCPAVSVRLDGFTRSPTRIVGLNAGGAPYDEVIRLSLRCVAFSAEGPANAARQRDTLVTQVLDALSLDATVGGRVFVLRVLGGDALPDGEQAGVFSGLVLSLEADTQA